MTPQIAWKKTIRSSWPPTRVECWRAGALLENWPSLIEPDTAQIIRAGAGRSARDYLDALHERAAYTRAWLEFFEEHDVLLTPMMQSTAFPIGVVAPSDIGGVAVDPILEDWCHLCYPGLRPALRDRARHDRYSVERRQPANRSHGPTFSQRFGDHRVKLGATDRVLALRQHDDVRSARRRLPDQTFCHREVLLHVGSGVHLHRCHRPGAWGHSVGSVNRSRARNRPRGSPTSASPRTTIWPPTITSDGPPVTAMPSNSE